MTQKQKNAIAWLEKTYGKFSYEYLKSEVVYLNSQDKSYPIQFWVDKEGFIYPIRFCIDNERLIRG